MTVEQARNKCVCRICGKPIAVSKGLPKDWETIYKVRVFPRPNVVLNFGEEFAHEECLNVDAKAQVK
jgi:hypothetical protein